MGEFSRMGENLRSWPCAPIGVCIIQGRVWEHLPLQSQQTYSCVLYWWIYVVLHHVLISLQTPTHTYTHPMHTPHTYILRTNTCMHIQSFTHTYIQFYTNICTCIRVLHHTVSNTTLTNVLLFSPDFFSFFCYFDTL